MTMSAGPTKGRTSPLAIVETHQLGKADRQRAHARCGDGGAAAAAHAQYAIELALVEQAARNHRQTEAHHAQGFVPVRATA